MNPADLPWTSAAVLIWLTPGLNPTDDDFSWEWVKPPPIPNPEAWWELRDAIIHAREVERPHGCGAWIKYGDRLLNEIDILGAYNWLREHGHP